MVAEELEKLMKSGMPRETLIDMAFDALNQAIREAQEANEESKRVYQIELSRAMEYREQWLKAERDITVLKHKLKEARAGSSGRQGAGHGD